MKKITLILMFVCVSLANAQRTCGIQEMMEKIMSDPIQREAYLKQQELFEIELQKLQNNNQYRTAETSALSTTRIPVAVHFPSAGSASSTVRSCLIALAQNQINRLNADYNATNTDITNWTPSVASFYPGTTIGVMNFQFELATQNHPSGTGLSNGQVAVTFGTDFLNGADTDSTWAGYINFVVRNEGNSILGYSPLGGFPSGGYTVVLNRFAFGSGSGCTGYVPAAPFNLGRTLTHELGHYFNLDHTFVSCGGSNCNTSGDRVCDTPATSVESYDCPAAGSVTSSCGTGQKSLTMNYMDYVDDACMYMFTTGQATRMQAWYNSISSQLTTNTLSNNEIVKNNYSLAPNPNNGTFVITFKDLTNDVSIEVFDVSGRIVYENYFTQNSNLSQEVKIENSSSGLYFINIKSGSTVVTEKSS